MGLALFLFEFLHIMNVPLRGITLLIGGGVIMAAGIFILIQFIRNNPIPNGDNYAQERE